ncbi:uncharacterized protein LOC106719791 [Papilio machaon]|uniref:uncharacterized protein LOC106719791 n=1 Tax=Papilio machaon TaxID=76193 RepID=UPI001E664478|nr:uncharacterized protein LOC106719791 [Papilio machaon]
MASGSLFLFIILVPLTLADENYRREGFLDKLSTGMKFAHDFLGSESVALKVADFVVRAFNTVNTPSPHRKQPPNMASNEESKSEENSQEDRPSEASNPMSPLRHVIRLLGLQPNQISAVAVNALVFVAQMISTFLTGTRRPGRPNRSDDPTTWILNKNSRRLQDLIATAKKESLPDLIEQMIQKQESTEETSCIRLLVCKITPFINKMQNTVFGVDDPNDNSKETLGAAFLYRHLPTSEEINNRSDLCERRHKNCNLNE